MIFIFLSFLSLIIIWYSLLLHF